VNKEAHTPNSGLAKGGLKCFEETFVLGSTVVLRMNISAEFPALRQAAKRWLQLFLTLYNFKMLLPQLKTFCENWLHN
jgi:hypothetical protein